MSESIFRFFSFIEISVHYVQTCSIDGRVINFKKGQHFREAKIKHEFKYTHKVQKYSLS